MPHIDEYVQHQRCAARHRREAVSCHRACEVKVIENSYSESRVATFRFGVDQWFVIRLFRDLVLVRNGNVAERVERSSFLGPKVLRDEQIPRPVPECRVFCQVAEVWVNCRVAQAFFGRSQAPFARRANRQNPSLCR